MLLKEWGGGEYGIEEHTSPSLSLVVAVRECVRKRYEEELSLRLRHSCRWDFFHLEFWLSFLVVLTVIVERASAADVVRCRPVESNPPPPLRKKRRKQKWCPDWVIRMQSGRKVIIACVSSNRGWNYLRRYVNGRLSVVRLLQNPSAPIPSGFIAARQVRNLVRPQLTRNNCKSVCQSLVKSKVPGNKNSQPRRIYFISRKKFTICCFVVFSDEFLTGFRLSFLFVIRYIL